MSEIVKVPFHGNEILAVEKNGKKYVAMKPIVEAMGLDWSQQVKNIKTDTVLNSVMGLEPITGSDGKRYEMVCLPLEYLNGWLFKVPANRYSGKRREAIELYQRECYHALYDYWHNGGAVNPRLDEAQAARVIGKITVAGEGRFPEEVYDALKAVCVRLEQNTQAMTVMVGRIVYLENFEPRGKPFETSKITGRTKDRFTPGYYSSNQKAKSIAALKSYPELPWGGIDG